MTNGSAEDDRDGAGNRSSESVSTGSDPNPPGADEGSLRPIGPRPPPALTPKPVSLPAPVYRDTIEALAVAVVLALTIKQFAVEAYKVPTGSMEPAIHGAEVGGDRILVDKIGYLARDPRRWEVAVFRFPNNLQINYIKRVVGLPDETLFIMGGDIYTAPFGNAYGDRRELWRDGLIRIQRKPRALQDDMFARYPQIDPSEEDPLGQETFQRHWVIPAEGLPGNREWTFEDGVLADSPSRSLVAFRGEVRDVMRFADAGAAAPAWGQRIFVGDVRVVVAARPARARGALAFLIHDPDHDLPLEARVPVAGTEEDGALLIDGEVVVSLGGFRLPVDEKTLVTFTNVDDTLSLRIGDEEIASTFYTHRPVERDERHRIDQRVCFGVDGAAIAFSDVGVFRDIYYRRGTGSYVDIPAGSYFMLGDNSAASKDSREWNSMSIRAPKREPAESREEAERVHPEDDDDLELYPWREHGRLLYRDSTGHVRDITKLPLVGDVEAVPDPHDLSSRLDNPWRENGRRYFMDRFGNIHDVTVLHSMTSELRTPSPFVPRDLIVGRAFAVFIPRIQVVR